MGSPLYATELDRILSLGQTPLVSFLHRVGQSPLMGATDFPVSKINPKKVMCLFKVVSLLSKSSLCPRIGVLIFFTRLLRVLLEARSVHKNNMMIYRLYLIKPKPGVGRCRSKAIPMFRGSYPTVYCFINHCRCRLKLMFRRLCTTAFALLI